MASALVPTGLIAAETDTAENSTAKAEFFEKRIRPLLVEQCQKCHSGNSAKGGLRLDSRAAALRGGDTGPAIVPGRPEDSLLIEAVNWDPAGYQMPPTGKLSAEAIAALTDWVRQGAVWPGGAATAEASASEFNLEERAKHWSFQPLRAVTVPEVAQADWAETPVDRFILSRLESAELKPSDRAERQTLLRRASYSLTGLPPTAEEVAAFLGDESPAAWANAIERLLASPRYGERWARHWLDLVRYAETGGHEFDFEIPFTTPYRDYVIRAFNDDLPYNQFVVEQIAGDLLPNPRRHPVSGENESVVGTAFYWLGQGKHSPVDIRAEECDIVDNQLDVIGKTFLGLTISCSRCHDHKFDPILQQDYYAFAGFLQSSRRNIVNTAPREPIERAADALVEQSRQDLPLVLTKLLAHSQRFIDELPSRLLSDQPADVAWRESFKEAAQKDRAHPLHLWVHWTADQNVASRISGWQQLRQREAAAVVEPTDFELHHPRRQTDDDGRPLPIWTVDDLAFDRNPATTWLLGESAEQPVRGVVRPGTWAHSGTISPRLHGTLRSPTFTITTPYLDYWMYRRGGEKQPARQNKVGQVHLIVDGFQVIRNPLYGNLTINVPQGTRPQWHRQDVRRFLGSRAYIEIEDLDDGEIIVEQIEGNHGAPSARPYNSLLTELVDAGTITNARELAEVYQQAFSQARERLQKEALFGAPTTKGRHGAAIADLWNLLLELSPLPTDDPELTQLIQRRREIGDQLPTPQWTLAMTDGTSEDEHLLVRGNHRKPGDLVPRQFLTVLQPHTRSGALGPSGGDFGSGRLEWAECMVDPRNPLAARVIVNRVWQHHFGRGLVPTPDDFGQMGQPPSHPELLDWLATEFMQQGWSLKQLHRLLLTSATYQQTSRMTLEIAEERDPQNLLLHRMSVKRLEAEPIRDALLALSGRLSDRMYGPSVLPHLTPFMEGRGRPGQSGPLDGDGRRSIYISVRRNFLSPMFLAFDFPTPFTTMGKRSSSNVPAQALTLLNNPLVLQQTALWADRVLRQTSDPQERVRQLYLNAFGRPANADEIQAALDYLGDAQQSPTAWQDLAHVLVNVKEFVFLD